MKANTSLCTDQWPPFARTLAGIMQHSTTVLSVSAVYKIKEGILDRFKGAGSVWTAPPGIMEDVVHITLSRPTGMAHLT